MLTRGGPQKKVEDTIKGAEHKDSVGEEKAKGMGTSTAKSQNKVEDTSKCE